MKHTIRITAVTAALVLAAHAANERWWTRSFPPPAIRITEAPLTLERGKVVDGLESGYLDAANAVAEGGVMLSGWAFDPRTKAPVKRVVILDNDRAARTAHVYRDRPDIAVLTKSRALLKTGWVLWIPGDEIAAGRHVFTAYAAFDDGTFGLVGTKTVELAPAK